MRFHIFNAVTISRGLVAILLATGVATAAAQTPVGTKLSIVLFDDFDTFGNQFEVVQAYEHPGGARSITTGIYDTGASVITFSAVDQEFLFPYQSQPPIPIKVFDGAEAEAIGGSGGTSTLIGDVSEPGKILIAGPSAVTINFTTLELIYNLNVATEIPGVQAFVGTSTGSPALPSIIGTPANAPSALHPSGLATKVEQQGFEFDLGTIDASLTGLIFNFPNTTFVPSGSNLVATASTYETISIPVQLYGTDNTANPGDLISAAPNPVVSNVTTVLGGNNSTGKTFLFDTGAQLSVISAEVAAELGIVEGVSPSFGSIDVAGAAGTTTLNGYKVDSLSMARGDGGVLEFTNVPVYVLSIGSGIDGILGMNLFNAADSLLYDPYGSGGAEVQVTFLNDRQLQAEVDAANSFASLDDPEFDYGAVAQALLAGLGTRYGVALTQFAGVPGFVVPVPEPSTVVLAIVGMVALVRRRRVRA